MRQPDNITAISSMLPNPLTYPHCGREWGNGFGIAGLEQCACGITGVQHAPVPTFSPARLWNKEKGWKGTSSRLTSQKEVRIINGELVSELGTFMLRESMCPRKLRSRQVLLKKLLACFTMFHAVNFHSLPLIRLRSAGVQQDLCSRLDTRLCSGTGVCVWVYAVYEALVPLDVALAYPVLCPSLDMAALADDRPVALVVPHLLGRGVGPRFAFVLVT